MCKLCAIRETTLGKKTHFKQFGLIFWYNSVQSSYSTILCDLHSSPLYHRLHYLATRRAHRKSQWRPTNGKVSQLPPRHRPTHIVAPRSPACGSASSGTNQLPASSLRRCPFSRANFSRSGARALARIAPRPLAEVKVCSCIPVCILISGALNSLPLLFRLLFAGKARQSGVNQ